MHFMGLVDSDESVPKLNDIAEDLKKNNCGIF
jgi:hypothetical protein